MSTLAEMFPQEQARLRALLSVYKDIGPVGRFGFLMIENVLKEADAASAAHDTAAMVRVYARMQECK